MFHTAFYLSYRSPRRKDGPPTYFLFLFGNLLQRAELPLAGLAMLAVEHPCWLSWVILPQKINNRLDFQIICFFRLVGRILLLKWRFLHNSRENLLTWYQITTRQQTVKTLPAQGIWKMKTILFQTTAVQRFLFALWATSLLTQNPDKNCATFEIIDRSLKTVTNRLIADSISEVGWVWSLK